MKDFNGNEITIKENNRRICVNNSDGSHATNWKHPDMQIHVTDSNGNKSWEGLTSNEANKK